jgi:uncharacterized protein (TIGR04255 family)
MSSGSTQRRVDFDHPPLNEVVFSVQFDDAIIDEVGVLSEFWPLIKPEFGRYEKHPPLPPAAESFDVPPILPEPSLRFIQSGVPVRYWFLNADGTLIVQVQPDRLMFNWRQVEGDEQYPHYDVLQPRFADLLNTFLDCEAVNRADARVSWIELQYVNPIPVDSSDDTHGQLAAVLNLLVKDPPRLVLPTVEDTQIQQRFRILGDSEQPQGRLYLTAVPAFRTTDNVPLYVITLLARGQPSSGTVEQSVSTFLDTAHHLIVNGFREVTTDEMHEKWGARWQS